LSESDVPVANVQVHCEDPGIIGVQFYVMDFVEGVVHRDLRLPDVPSGRRRAIYYAAIDMLARINRLDVDRLDLRSFGRPGHYFRRQLHRWKEQYKASLPDGDATTDRLILALESLMPDNDESPVLLHGDSRLDNLMFAPGAEQIVAVLDWELSTLGHPLADLGQFLAVQALPSDYLMPGLKHIDRSKESLPTATEQALRYFAATGLPPRDMRFYQGFAMFRQAAMAAGLKRRAALGTAVNETALLFGDTMSVFAQTGLEILEGKREI
jgi:aminoglycoside phosphotransferase (APT) family kinase protein